MKFEDIKWVRPTRPQGTTWEFREWEVGNHWIAAKEIRSGEWQGQVLIQGMKGQFVRIVPIQEAADAVEKLSLAYEKAERIEKWEASIKEYQEKISELQLKVLELQEARYNALAQETP